MRRKRTLGQFNVGAGNAGAYDPLVRDPGNGARSVDVCAVLDSAIEIGVVDAKIEPSQTRSVLTQALAEAPHRRGRHKNIPL